VGVRLCRGCVLLVVRVRVVCELRMELGVGELRMGGVRLLVWGVGWWVLDLVFG
jgi:hypothetical protein